MKLTKGVIFANISRSAFFVFFAAFLYLKFGFVMFWRKNMGAKAACKMLLVKLTTDFDIFERTFEIANIRENRKLKTILVALLKIK